MSLEGALNSKVLAIQRLHGRNSAYSYVSGSSPAPRLNFTRSPLQYTLTSWRPQYVPSPDPETERNEGRGCLFPISMPSFAGLIKSYIDRCRCRFFHTSLQTPWTTSPSLRLCCSFVEAARAVSTPHTPAHRSLATCERCSCVFKPSGAHINLRSPRN